MNSLRWRIALWFTLSVLVVAAVFVGATHAHLQHELRAERWERAHPDHPDWVLHGSYSDAEVDDIAGELWRISLLYALPVTALTLGAGYFLAKRSFQPVAEINRQLQAIGARSLDQRVSLTQADVEFRAIENNVNALLLRLDGSFRQLTEFSAQVAHELRTPLTLLRLQIEEAAGGIEPALAESLQDELSRLSDYVDQCLLLATAEQGRLALDIKPVALRALVTEMIEIYELLARSENRELTVIAPEELRVEADPRTLRQMLHNLLTNALRHGTGPITVTVGRDGAESVCRIDNAIAGKPGVDSPAVGDGVAKGRGGHAVISRRGGGTAFGLRIVRAIALSHPGLVFKSQGDAGRFMAELRWR